MCVCVFVYMYTLVCVASVGARRGHESLGARVKGICEPCSMEPWLSGLSNKQP